MVLSLLLLLTLGLAHADCPDAGGATARAIDALIAAKLDLAETELHTAEAGFSCGAPISTELLARFWLAEAAVSSVQGRDQDARDAWQAAARVAPGLWDARYGADLQAKRNKAIATMSAAKGSLKVDPLPPKSRLRVDGVVVTNPTFVPEGLHLVQVDHQDVDFGKLVLLGAGENMQIGTSLVAEEERRPRGRKIALVTGGGLGLVAGAGLLVVAARQDAGMEAAEAGWRAGELSSDDALALAAHHWNVQRGTGGAGYALLALGVAGVGIGIVW